MDGLVAGVRRARVPPLPRSRGWTTAYTYRAFNDEIDRAANVFLSLGVQAGERVAVQLCTCPEFMMCLFGLAKIGAVWCP
ncbi:MAG: AMP-binding protein [Gordonibacter pamelaeae]